VLFTTKQTTLQFTYNLEILSHLKSFVFSKLKPFSYKSWMKALQQHTHTAHRITNKQCKVTQTWHTALNFDSSEAPSAKPIDL